MCKKGTQTQSFLQRNLRGCTRATEEKAYKTYVEPILNYSSTVWNPIGEGNQGLWERLEMVQRKSAHFFFSQWQRDSSPTNMINKLKWKTLEAQRQIRNLIMMHKIIHNAIEIVLSFLSNTECILFWQIHGQGNLFVPATGGLWDYLLIDISNTHELVNW